MKKSVRLIPGKTWKRKVIHKAKFSQKLNDFFLEPMEQYAYEEDGTLEKIQPVLYTDLKFAINITCPVEKEQLETYLSQVLFPFDLYCSTLVSHKRKICYLNKQFTTDLMILPSQMMQYDYVMNIDNIEMFSFMRPGFIEASFSLLQKGASSFIYSEEKDQFYKVESRPFERPDFIELLETHPQVTVEDLFYNHQIPSFAFFLFSTKILNDVGVLSQKESWKKEDGILFRKFLFLLSLPKLTSFQDQFKRIEFVPLKMIDVYDRSMDSLFEELSQYETVTFDIFDTLVTRTLFQPNDLFDRMEKKSTHSFSKPFLEIRKRAEQKARETFLHDVNLDEIYEVLEEEEHLSKEESKRLKDLEIALELEHLIPRKEMVELFNRLIKSKIHVDLISDMYLKKEVIEKILFHCGIQNYRDLYISCEENKRKDTGAMWDFYFEKMKENTIHVGDNYQSDYLAVLKRGRPAVKVLSSRDFLDYYGAISPSSIEESISFGKLYNQFWLNSPFLVRERMKEDLSCYGKYFLAPIFFTFFNWFEKVNTSSKILFISREGYYLQKIYQYYCQIFSKKEVDNIYFLASRRAVSFASCETEEDLIELLNTEFTGSISDLFRKRYGFEFTKEMELTVRLPESKEEVIPFVSLYAKELLEKAKIERENYLHYFNSVCSSSFDHLSIIDLGYSGTTQYYLSKLTNKKIEGYYFAITKKKLPQRLQCKILGCMNTDNATYIDDENLFYRKSLYLEAFLSAPEGQLICFDKEHPVFTNGEFNKKKKVYLDEIYEGVLKGLEDLKEIGFDGNQTDTINQHYRLICHFLKNCEGRLHKVFYMDDDYCTNGKEIRDLTKVLQ